jgi:hypothetical protein
VLSCPKLKRKAPKPALRDETVKRKWGRERTPLRWRERREGEREDREEKERRGLVK